MLRPSASMAFPFKNDNENNCFKRTHTNEDAIMSAVRCFITTRKGSRLGNNIGSFLPELLMELIPNSKLGELSVRLRDELSNQFPGVDFVNVAISRQLTRNASELIVKITFTIARSEMLTDMTIALPSIFSTEFQSEL
jgi:hypothetical protein